MLIGTRAAKKMGGEGVRTGKISCMLVVLAVVLASRTPEVRAGESPHSRR